MTGSARRRTVSRQPSTQRSKAMRRGALMLVAGILVPVAVIIVHLSNLDDAASPNGPVSSERHDHLWADATDLPPVPPTDPTEHTTPRSAPPTPGGTARHDFAGGDSKPAGICRRSAAGDNAAGRAAASG